MTEVFTICQEMMPTGKEEMVKFVGKDKEGA